MDSVRAIGKALFQKLCCVIGLGNDGARGIEKFIETDLEVSRRENVVCVRGKAEIDAEELVDPTSGARGETGEVRVDVANSEIGQAQPNINRLIKTKKIGSPFPFIKRGNDLSREVSLFGSSMDFVQQLLFPGQIMNIVYNALVPILRRLVLWLADRENGRGQALSIQLSDLSIAEGL